MRIAFRADASLDIGTGHVMRCLTLAHKLAGRGAEIKFVCREHPGHLAENIRAQGFDVALLGYSDGGEERLKKNNPHAAWVGAPQAEDAAETRAALGDFVPNWLVVDHYGLDVKWESLVRPAGGRILVIDDLANRAHVCDLLLDQNYFRDAGQRYAGRLPSHCSAWLGPRYALLRPEYAQARKTRDRKLDKVERLLVFVGGSDRQNLTSKLVSLLDSPAFAALHVDVVVGGNHEHVQEVEALVTRRPRTMMHRNLPHLANVMAEADLAIGAGGATTWERFCMGVPAVVVSLASNQEAICEELQDAGLITYLGRLDQVNEERFRAVLLELLASPDHLQAQSRRSQVLVDGNGASRIAELMIPTSTDHLKLRQARPDDGLQYFDWVNDPSVRASAFDTAPIPLARHLNWFANKLKAQNSFLYVLEASGLPVGQMRLEQEPDGIWIDYSLDGFVRGRGWGVELIRRGAEMLGKHRDGVLRARVKRANAVSASVFLRLGFEETPSSEAGMRVFARAVDDFCTRA